MKRVILALLIALAVVAAPAGISSVDAGGNTPPEPCAGC